MVYGSRTLGQWAGQPRWTLFPGKHANQGKGPWLAGVLLTLWTALMYGRWITDTLTAYKLYPGPVVKAMKLRTSGFETDHEITAKLSRLGKKIVEVPIAYYPRSQEGEEENQTLRRIHCGLDAFEVPIHRLATTTDKSYFAVSCGVVPRCRRSPSMLGAAPRQAS